jgi:hypothetical protein
MVMILFAAGFIFHSISRLNKRPSEYAEKLIVLIFFVQSCIEIIAFLSSDVASFIHLFYPKDKIERLYDAYGGIRGLALTSAPGWGLSVGFGLSFLFYIKSYIINKKINFISIVIGLVLILGTFFSGRSGFIGAIIGLLYYFFARDKTRLKVRNIMYAIILILVVILASLIILPKFVDLLIERVFPFVFEFYYKYESTGILQTNSTNVFKKMWSISIEGKDILFGTGLFTDSATGEYYRGVDIGYLRNLLYGGIPLFILLIIFQIHIGRMKFITLKFLSYNNKLFIVTLFLCMFVFEAKAMAVGFLKYQYTILIFYHLSLIYEYEIIPRYLRRS